MKGNLELIVGLILTLILKYQISLAKMMMTMTILKILLQNRGSLHGAKWKFLGPSRRIILTRTETMDAPLPAW